MSSCKSGSGLEHVLDPVPHGVHADGDVVDLTMVKAALLATEHLERLVLRAHRREAFLRERKRYLLVAFAVQEQERAAHLLHDAVQAKIVKLLKRRRLARRR